MFAGSVSNSIAPGGPLIEQPNIDHIQTNTFAEHSKLNLQPKEISNDLIDSLINEAPDAKYFLSKSDYITEKPDQIRAEIAFAQLQSIAQNTTLWDSTQWIANRICNRYMLLETQTQALRFLKKSELLRTACFIEVENPLLNQKIQTVFNSECYYKKKAHGLPYALQSDKRNEFYILLKGKYYLFQQQSTSKIIRAATHFESLKNTIPACPSYAQATNKDIYDPETEAAWEKENFIYTSCENMRGIWKLLSYAKYTKHISYSNRDIFKASIIQPRGIGDLTDVKKGTFSTYDIACIALDIAYGIFAVHNLGHALGDLKLENILFGQKSDGTYFAGLIDFATAFRPGIDKPPYAYSRGWYGTVLYTPPEILAAKSYNAVDEFYANDLYAFGLILYELLNHASPPWYDLIGIYYNTTLSKSRDVQPIIDSMRSSEEHYFKLQQQSALTVKEWLEKIMYSLLQIIPSNRPKISDVIQELKDCVASAQEKIKL